MFSFPLEEDIVVIYDQLIECNMQVVCIPQKLGASLKGICMHPQSPLCTVSFKNTEGFSYLLLVAVILVFKAGQIL